VFSVPRQKDMCVQATALHALNFARSFFNGARQKFPFFSLFARGDS